METIKKDSKYFEAKRKVRKIRAFYQSLFSAIIILGMLAALNYFVNQWRNPWFLWAAFGWGIGLFAQASKVFEWDRVFGRKWEEKSLRKLMENSTKEKATDGAFEGRQEFQYEEKKSKAYLKAKRKVETLKAFYLHLLVFILMNSLMILYFSGVFSAREIDFSFWGIYVVLFFWGIGLLSHGIYVLFIFNFKNTSLKRWEQRKINEILEKDSL